MTSWQRATALMASVLAAVVVAAPASGVDVAADDERDVYVGSGGLVLPRGSASEADRARAAACEDCRWRLTDPCSVTGGPCSSVTRGCPGGRLLRAWTSRDGGRTWSETGLPCIGPAGPVTVESGGREVADRVERALPPAAISWMPAQGALPRLPVTFEAGQEAIGPVTLDVLGRRATVVPSPAWHWDFGDGATLATGLPGSRYPDLAVSHAYRRPGSYAVTVRTTWTATFSIDGLGPFAVPAIHQEARATLRIVPGRAVLVP